MSKTHLNPKVNALTGNKLSKRINLDFRPDTYFWPLSLKTHLLSHVKGAGRREVLKRAIANDDLEEILQMFGDSELSEQAREALGSIHPLFLGGEYLPEREETEVEIARVTLASMTFDVTSVYARFEDGKLHYRVVDEYDGGTLAGPAACTSETPLTLGELFEFFERAWPIMEVMKLNEMNFEGNLRAMLGFFKADSAFYPELDALYRRHVRAAYRKRKANIRNDARFGEGRL